MELELFRKGQLAELDEDLDEVEDPKAVAAPTDFVTDPGKRLFFSLEIVNNSCILVPHADKKEEIPPEQIALQNYQYKGATVHVHPLLSSLVIYTQPVKVSDWCSSVAKRECMLYSLESQL